MQFKKERTTSDIDYYVDYTINIIRFFYLKLIEKKDKNDKVNIMIFLLIMSLFIYNLIILKRNKKLFRPKINENMTVRTLRKICRKYNIKNYTKYRKTELIYYMNSCFNNF
jgi:hypothetical protein